jgi:hypothetical protein
MESDYVLRRLAWSTVIVNLHVLLLVSAHLGSLLTGSVVGDKIEFSTRRLTPWKRAVELLGGKCQINVWKLGPYQTHLARDFLLPPDFTVAAHLHKIV